MRETVLQILKKHLELKTMEEDADTWRLIENDPDTYVPTAYAHDAVVYQDAYFSDVHEELADASVVLYSGGKAAGIWPLCIFGNPAKYEIGSSGGVLQPPLLRGNKHTVEAKRRLLKKCMGALDEICVKFGVEKYRTSDVALREGASVWTRMLLEGGARCIGVNHECFVDLSLEEQDILSRIRRTNKYSILKSQQAWKGVLIRRQSGRKEIESCFEQFRKLHIEVSGRETRSKKTWDIQCGAVLDANDFVIMLHDRREQLIGASLYGMTGSMGSYSVAAYRRELFGQPVSHVSQWLAIRHMKEQGLKWYYVGKRPYPGDWDRPSEKEASIGHFKEGFATDIFPRLHLECTVRK